MENYNSQNILKEYKEDIAQLEEQKQIIEMVLKEKRLKAKVLEEEILKKQKLEEEQQERQRYKISHNFRQQSAEFLQYIKFHDPLNNDDRERPLQTVQNKQTFIVNPGLEGQTKFQNIKRIIRPQQIEQNRTQETPNNYDQAVQNKQTSEVNPGLEGQTKIQNIKRIIRPQQIEQNRINEPSNNQDRGRSLLPVQIKSTSVIRSYSQNDKIKIVNTNHIDDHAFKQFVLTNQFKQQGKMNKQTVSQKSLVITKIDQPLQISSQQNPLKQSRVSLVASFCKICSAQISAEAFASSCGCVFHPKCFGDHFFVTRKCSCSRKIGWNYLKAIIGRENSEKILQEQLKNIIIKQGLIKCTIKDCEAHIKLKQDFIGISVCYGCSTTMLGHLLNQQKLKQDNQNNHSQNQQHSQKSSQQDPRSIQAPRSIQTPQNIQDVKIIKVDSSHQVQTNNSSRQDGPSGNFLNQSQQINGNNQEAKFILQTNQDDYY